MKRLKEILRNANGPEAPAKLEQVRKKTAEHAHDTQDYRTIVRAHLGEGALRLTPDTSQLAAAHAEAAMREPVHVVVRDLTPDAQPIRVSVAA